MVRDEIKVARDPKGLLVPAKYYVVAVRRRWLFPLAPRILGVESYADAVDTLSEMQKDPRVFLALMVAGCVTWTPRHLARRHSLSRTWNAIREQERADERENPVCRWWDLRHRCTPACEGGPQQKERGV